MIMVTNGIDVLEVTDGAYASIFKSQGYRPVDVQDAASEVIETSEAADAEEVVDLETKPLSQWRKEEVAAFAEVNGIDLSGTKNVNEAKKVIKEFLDKAEADAAEADAEDDDWD